MTVCLMPCSGVDAFEQLCLCSERQSFCPVHSRPSSVPCVACSGDGLAKVCLLTSSVWLLVCALSKLRRPAMCSLLQHSMHSQNLQLHVYMIVCCLDLYQCLSCIGSGSSHMTSVRHQMLFDKVSQSTIASSLEMIPMSDKDLHFAG